MKKYFLSLLLIFLLVHTGKCQLLKFYVAPHAIDTAYAVAQDSDFVVLNNSVTSNNKLMVFLPGTGANTKNYTDFPILAANLGYHSINLSYPNGFATIDGMCGPSTDSLCFDNVRQEICYGTPVSSNVSVDTLNSINMRLIKMLQYLAANYPTDGWSQFLSGNLPSWNKIAICGHSQGSGHALYFGKTQNCERVIMFSGADDYSSYYSEPAHWIYSSKITPINRYFSFLHLQDDVMPYPEQLAILQALGMTSNGDDSTIVDNKTSPYNTSHCLYTNANPLHSGIYSAYHDGTVVDYFTPLDSVGDALYMPIWTYMLTASVPTDVSEISNSKQNLLVFPNPSSSIFSVVIPSGTNADYLQIVNTLGQIIFKKDIAKNAVNYILSVDLNNFPAGIYFLKAGNKTAKIVRK